MVAAGVVAGLSVPLGSPFKFDDLSLPSDVYYIRWADKLSNIADVKSRCSVYK